MCFLIPALVGLISALLGYLLGRMLSGGNDLNLKSKLDASLNENEKLNHQIYLLEKNKGKINVDTNNNSDLEACQKRNQELLLEIESLKTKSNSDTKLGFSSTTVTVSFDAAAALAVLGKKIKADDLKIVEGIGPKIEELYHAAGIKTWKQLSETPTATSKSILDNAGNRYAIHNPETWAKQALLAYEGKWDELKKYQDSLHGGKA